MRKRKTTVSEDQICLLGFFEEPSEEGIKTIVAESNTVYIMPSLFDMVTAVNAAKKIASEVAPEPIAKPMEYYPSCPAPSVVDAQERIARNIAALKTMNTAKTSCATITASEQECIAAYTGWDGLATTKEEMDELIKHLEFEFTPEAAKSLLEKPRYPYTPEPWAIQSIFMALEKMGFATGNVLCVGSGNGAVLRAMPPEMRTNSVLFAEATDVVNQDLLSLLYPSVKIYSPNDELTTSFFDLAIGIIPTAPNDKATLKCKGQTATFERYAYHLTKALCALRTGGIMAVLMPSNVTDEMATKLSPFELSGTPLHFAGGLRLDREAMGNHQSYDLLCFQKQVKAGTPKESVLAQDTIIIQRMLPIKNSTSVRLKIPQYFSCNPQMVIGEYLYGDGKALPQESILTPLTGDRRDAIADAIDDWECKNIFEPISVDGESEDNNVRPADPRVKNYSMVVYRDGKVWQRIESTMVRQKLAGIRLERVIGMIAIRDAAIKLIQLQFTDCTDEELEEAQQNLSSCYDPFVKRYGRVTERTNTLLFREDADFSVLAALEYTDEEDVIHPADIFTKRTIQIRPPITACETPDEALLVCLD